MRNYKGAFYRTDEISREPINPSPDWIDLLVTKMEVDETIKTAASKSAVEVARERQRSHQPSIYEMMSAIVSGQKPKYSSVEEAVKDYQRRTGLEDYLKRAGDNDLSVLASQIIAEAAHGSCHKCGNSKEECECPKDENDADDEESDDEEDEEDGDKDDARLDSFRQSLNLDYGEARDMTEEELKDNPGKKKLISEAEGEKPALLVKNPAIEQFITNVIDTNYGIQIPAILHSLIETFGRDGVNHEVFSDRDLLNWINQKLIDRGAPNNDIPSHLGRGVGTHIDYSGEKDSNKDPFTLLVPDKSSL